MCTLKDGHPAWQFLSCPRVKKGLENVRGTCRSPGLHVRCPATKAGTIRATKQIPAVAHNGCGAKGTPVRNDGTQEITQANTVMAAAGQHHEWPLRFTVAKDLSARRFGIRNFLTEGQRVTLQGWNPAGTRAA